MPIEVLPAGVDDVPVIRAIALRTWPVAYREILSEEQLAYMLQLMYAEDVLRDQIGTGGHRFLLAMQDGRAIGFAGLQHAYQQRANTRLHKLYVLPEAQGTGAGKFLLQAVLLAASKAGDSGVELNVNRFNKALDFYIRNGFAIVRSEVIDIGQGYVMDDHVLWKSSGLDH